MRLLAASAVLLAWAPGVGADAGLFPARKTVLTKTSGRIDQAIPLASGEFLVRDADLSQPQSQALEIYDASGRLQKKIGNSGPKPGSYQYLKGMAVSRNRSIWVADLIGRLTSPAGTPRPLREPAQHQPRGARGVPGPVAEARLVRGGD